MKGCASRHERTAAYDTELVHHGSAMEVDVDIISPTYGLFSFALMPLAHPEFLAFYPH